MANRRMTQEIAYELWRRYEQAHAQGQRLPPLAQLKAAVWDVYPDVPGAVVDVGVELFLEGLFTATAQKIQSHRYVHEVLVDAVIQERRRLPRACLPQPNTRYNRKNAPKSRRVPAAGNPTPWRSTPLLLTTQDP
jgi:hypothetical protein